MADNSGSTGTFKKSPTFQKSAGTFAKPGTKTTKPNDALGNILSFGQTAIDTISTPLYFVSGLVNGAIDNIQGDKTNDIIKRATDNAFAWQSGKKVTTGKDILENLGYLKKDQYGATDPDSVGGFLSSLATDVLLDPLTYTPAVLISAPLKVASTVGRRAIGAANLARKGQSAAEIVAGARNVPVSALEDLTTVATTRKPIVPERLKKTAGIQVTSPRLKTRIAGAGQQKVERVLERYMPEADVAANYKYQTAAVNKADRGLMDTANQMAVSAIIAGRRAMADTILSISAREYLTKHAKDAVKEAKKLGKVIPASAVPVATYRALVDTAEDVTPEMTTPEAVQITSTAGEKAEFAPYTAYEYDNGTYVGDGSNIYKFNNVDDAEAWIQGSTAAAPAIREVTVAKSGKGYNVAVNGEATRSFKTKKEADTYAKTVQTGERVQPVMAPVRRSGDPILDLSSDQTIVEQIKNINISDADVKKSQATLKALDAIARKATATRSGTTTEIATRIRNLLGIGAVGTQRLFRTVPATIWKNMDISLKNEIGYGPFDFLKELMAKARDNRSVAELLKMLMNTRLKSGKTIGQLYDSGTAFNALSKDGSIQKEIADVFKSKLRILSMGNVKRQQTLFAEIAKLAGANGEELAKAIEATGFLNTLSDEAAKKVNDILGSLDVAVEEVKYGNLNELLAGMRNERHSVDSKTLMALLKRLDPDAIDIAKVERYSEADAQTYLSNVLLGEGTQTVNKTRRLIDLAKDPDTLLKAIGVGYYDVAAAYVSKRIKGGYGPEDAAIEAKNATHSRQAAAERMANNWGQVLKMSRADSGYPRWATAMSTMLDARLEDIYRLSQDPNSIERLTTLGDAALTNGLDPYVQGSEAILKLQLNQFTDTTTFGSLNGTLTKRDKNAVAGGKEKVRLTATERVQTNINDYDKVRDGLLATMGARPRISKIRDDIDFQEKYANEIYDNQAHFVFLDNGDIMRAFAQTDAGRVIMEQAFYPGQHFGWKSWKAANDTFSVVAVDDLVRRMLEVKEADGIYKREELIERAMKRADAQGTPSPRFQTIYRTIAENMVDYLIDNDSVITALADLHQSRLIATITDSFNGAQSLSEDVFTTLIDGWRANYAKGMSLSTAERRALVKDNFRRFVYASGLMRLKGGDVAETVFRAAAMAFIDGGRLKDLASKSPHATLKDTDLIDTEEIGEFLRNYYALRNTERAAEVVPTGPVEPQIILPKKQREKLEKDYNEARYAYEESMRRLPDLADDVARKKWEKDFDKIQAKLEDVRYKARQAGFNTQHYVFGDWVDSSVYNRDAALKLAEQQNLRYLATEAGVEDRARFLVDTRPELPKAKKLTKKQKEELLTNFRQQDELIQLEKQKEAIENAAEAVLKDSAKFDELPLTEAEKGQRMIQESYSQSLLAPEMEVYTSYRSRSGIRNKDVHDNLAARVGERIWGPSGRWNTVQLLHKVESTGINRVARFAEYLDALRKTYTGVVNMDDIAEVWTSIVNDIDMPANTPEELLTFRDDLKRATDLLIKSADTSELAAMGLDGKALAASFAKYGVTDKKGIPSFADNSSKGMVDWLRKLPFAKRPEDILEDSEDYFQWTKNVEQFKNSGEDPFLMLTRIMEGVQMAKSERTLALDFTARFGWQAAGFKSAKEAIDKGGFVKIKGIGAAEGDLTRFIPSPENGGLFPPEIAEEFGSLVREFNELYNNRMPDWTKTIMEVQGFLKATQTILRAGHHVTNFSGDVGTALIMGVRNPIHWRSGWRLVQKSRLSQSAIGEADRRLDRLFGRAFRAFEGEGKAYETIKDGKETLQFALAVKGKPRLVDFTDDDIIRMFEERGILISNIFANDIQGLADNIIADTAGPGSSAYKRMAARFTSTARKIEKPAGDFAAWYGNATRAAHALKVMQSQAWDNIDDALDAAADAVNKFHPTVQSLSSTERKWPRFAFSYYTWLRVAHNALADMALNHTAAMTFYSKVQYNMAAANEQEPISIGQPWADKTKVPGYLAYSVYGPTSTGPRGGLIFKPAYLPMDVLDTWNISYDPSKNIEQNAFMNTESISRTLGKSINLIVQPGIETLTQTDMSTGKPLNIKNVQDVADQMIGNLGFATLLKGLNLYTPQNKLPENTSNPITDRDRQLNLVNWMTGLKFRDTMTPADLRNARSETSQRIKEWLLEQYKQQQETK